MLYDIVLDIDARERSENELVEIACEKVGAVRRAEGQVL